jgi:hypothetical protein
VLTAALAFPAKAWLRARFRLFLERMEQLLFQPLAFDLFIKIRKRPGLYSISAQLLSSAIHRPRAEAHYTSDSASNLTPKCSSAQGIDLTSGALWFASSLWEKPVSTKSRRGRCVANPVLTFYIVASHMANSYVKVQEKRVTYMLLRSIPTHLVLSLT